MAKYVIEYCIAVWSEYSSNSIILVNWSPLITDPKEFNSKN